MISASKALSAMGHPNYSEAFAKRVLDIAERDKSTCRRAIAIARFEIAEIQRKAN